MADESEETLDDRLSRIQLRAETFRELLKDGDEVVVAFEDGEVHVAESYRSKLERKHPKLFGRMLSIEAQLDAGLSPYFAALIVAALFIVGLHLKWWNAVLGEELADYLQTWWFYVPLPFVLLYLARLGCARWERRAYRRNRAELLALIAAEKLDRDILLVMLRGESDLDGVVYELKLDPGPFPQAG